VHFSSCIMHTCIFCTLYHKTSLWICTWLMNMYMACICYSNNCFKILAVAWLLNVATLVCGEFADNTVHCFVCCILRLAEVAHRDVGCASQNVTSPQKRNTLHLRVCSIVIAVNIQGGPAKVRPTYIFYSNIWMHR